MSDRDTFECPRCLQESAVDEACWSELEQMNLCFDCYCEVEEN